MLCQHNSRFLTFFILLFSFAFFPLLLGHFARCHLKFCPLFSYSLLFHSLSFRGSLRFFAMSVCFNSDFLTFFILLFSFALCYLGILLFVFGSLLVLLFSVVSFAVFWGQSSLFFNICLFHSISVCFNSRFLTFFILFFAPLPFPLLLKHFALCPLEVCPLFSYSLLFHSLSFRGSLRFFAMSVCFNSDFLTFFILFFAPLPFSLCFWDISRFALYFWDILLFVLWKFTRFFILCYFIRCLFGAVFAFRKVCLFQQPFSYLFYIVFCPFAPFLCFWDISPFALYFLLLLFSFFFVFGIHLLHYF